MNSPAFRKPPETRGAEVAAPTIDAVLSQARDQLAAGRCLPPQTAALEARLLLTHVLACSRTWLITHGDEPLPEAAGRAFGELIGRRLGGEPVAYLVGEREFFGLPFCVDREVLIPRPETELLVELALARIPADTPLRILDLGTGSGVVALTLAHLRPRAQVTAVDVSPGALAVARANACRLGLAGVRFVESDWFTALGSEECFDVIVGNPPYLAQDDPHLGEGDLRFEPRHALVAGADGLAALRAIVAGLPGRLSPGGWLLLEHGWDQGAACRQLFVEAGLTEVGSERDLAGHERVTVGRQPVSPSCLDTCA
jgi:release factor glutamine methyltransferase